MRSLASFKQTTIVQQAVITFAIGILCLNAIQLQVSSLFFGHSSIATTTHNRTIDLQLTKAIINLETDIASSFADMSNYFNAVNNARTARLVIPKIKQFSTQIDRWKIQIDNLALRDQVSVIMIAKENLGALEVVVEDVMKTPEVASVLESNVTRIMNKLSILDQL